MKLSGEPWGHGGGLGSSRLGDPSHTGPEALTTYLLLRKQ